MQSCCSPAVAKLRSGRRQDGVTDLAARERQSFFSCVVVDASAFVVASSTATIYVVPFFWHAGSGGSAPQAYLS